MDEFERDGLARGSHEPPTDPNIPHTDRTFASGWHKADETLLRPNLAIPKVLRAYDRAPLSPFSRQRVRVGKVWKRPAKGGSFMSLASTSGQRIGRTRKARSSFQGSDKPVKKMRLGSDLGVTARVSRWDVVGSPVRKIVTRSGDTGEDLLALPDEEHDAQLIEGAEMTVEILEEDGTILDVGGEELANQEEWADEAEEAESSDQDMAPEDAMRSDRVEMSEVRGREDASATFPRALRERKAGSDATKLPMLEHENKQQPNQSVDEEVISSAMHRRDIRSETVAASNGRSLPEGFVSPAKASSHFATSRKSLKISRRRTLPVNFTPTVTTESALSGPTTDVATTAPDPPFSETEDDVLGTEPVAALCHVEVSDPADDEQDLSVRASAEDTEWEDVDEDFPRGSDHASEVLEPAFMDDSGPFALTSNRVQTSPASDEEKNATPNIVEATPLVQSDARSGSDHGPSSSPAPSTDGPHPRLPLRRSPRRKSSSPPKKCTVDAWASKPHLVAFTPLRERDIRPHSISSFGPKPSFMSQDEDCLEQASPIARAASAPPEEANMSPQKPSKPRISDDTALLQAFLNRAAENKSSRRLSTSKRESMTNRRDSDAVRQALASPAKVDVLTDLDPNSPSPHKQAAAVESTVITDEQSNDLPQLEPVEDSELSASTRRSGRAARRAQTSFAGSPNKIAIRGNSGGVVLKAARTEAQELAALTRINTRKNKDTAVFPKLRLTQIAAQAANNDEAGVSANGDDMRLQPRPDGARGVTWAEVLTDFFQLPELPESSDISEEFSRATAQVEQAEKHDEHSVAAPPTPSETPSKPKIRRLKSPRTASTPVQGSSGTHTQPAKDVPKTARFDTTSQPPASNTSLSRKRSRIATPAKPLPTPSTRCLDISNSGYSSASSAAPKAAPTKKPTPSSRLPAPLPSTSLTSSISQGKENLISSPPKKRPPPAAAATAKSGRSLKLDFALKLEMENSTGKLKKAKDSEELPGLSSPAKKRTRREM